MSTHILNTIDPAVLGERIMEARRARGLTQETVATALGVARTTITAMEKGERRPRAAELVKMSQLFGRPVGDFVRGDSVIDPPDFIVQFREATKGTARAAERERDIRKFEQLCIWFAEMEHASRSTAPRTFPDVYQIDGVESGQAAINVASSERNRLGLGDGPIADLWGILETDVGLRLFAFPMEDRTISGMFVFSDAFGCCIAVNANHPRDRQRLTLAHEYGHFLTDRFRPDITVFERSKRKTKSEQFADVFALNLLIPATGLSRRFADVRRNASGVVTAADLLQLSHLYRVSVEAMALRLEGLDLLPRGTWDELKEQRFRPNEAKRLLGLEIESGGAVRLPARYVSLAIQAFEQGELSEGELARLLLTNRLVARQQVLQATTEEIPTGDGEWRQIRFDLTAPLLVNR